MFGGYHRVGDIKYKHVSVRTELDSKVQEYENENGGFVEVTRNIYKSFCDYTYNVALLYYNTLYKKDRIVMKNGTTKANQNK